MGIFPLGVNRLFFYFSSHAVLQLNFLRTFPCCCLGNFIDFPLLFTWGFFLILSIHSHKLLDERISHFPWFFYFLLSFMSWYRWKLYSLKIYFFLWNFLLNFPCTQFSIPILVFFIACWKINSSIYKRSRRKRRSRENKETKNKNKLGISATLNGFYFAFCIHFCFMENSFCLVDDFRGQVVFVVISFSLFAEKLKTNCFINCWCCCCCSMLFSYWGGCCFSLSIMSLLL